MDNIIIAIICAWFKHGHSITAIICILLTVLFGDMQRDEDHFFHALSFSFNEIKHFLLNRIVDRIFFYYIYRGP